MIRRYIPSAHLKQHEKMYLARTPSYDDARPKTNSDAAADSVEGGPLGSQLCFEYDVFLSFCLPLSLAATKLLRMGPTIG